MKVKTILLDFDGVIGSETKYLDGNGNRAFLSVSSRDCEALKRIKEQGHRVIIVTASSSYLISAYAEKYGIRLVSSTDKLTALMKENIDWENTIAIGDDLGDVEMLQKAAKAYCPADAHPKLKGEFQPLQSKGGQGVICELLYNYLLWSDS